MLLIKNAKIKPMVGCDIENGYIHVGFDGKILAVGEGVADIAAETVIDAGGRLVTPGLVEGHCHLGYDGGAGSGFNETTDPITPHLRAIDALEPRDKEITSARESGITTICTGPGSTNIIGGTFAAIKTYGKRIDDMIVKYPLAMKCAFGENPANCFGNEKGRAPRTRMMIAAMLRELFFKTRIYLEAKEGGKNPTFDMKLEAMIPVLKGELPLKCHVHTATDIFTLIRIANEFGFKFTIDHCTDGSLIAEELAELGLDALVGPSFGAKTKRELENKCFDTLGVLHKAGVRVSVITDAPVTQIRYLSMFAGFAVAAGLPYDEGWRAITINPAVTVGISDRVGSLEVGKDGDAVIWDGDPLKEIGATTAYMTVINGKVVFQKN